LCRVRRQLLRPHPKGAVRMLLQPLLLPPKMRPSPTRGSTRRTTLASQRRSVPATALALVRWMRGHHILRPAPGIDDGAPAGPPRLGGKAKKKGMPRPKARPAKPKAG
jgi:hypothetical protein